MSASLDLDTVFMYRGSAYIGWVRPSDVYVGLYEAHYVPKDNDYNVIVVSLCDIDKVQELGNILDDLIDRYPRLFKGDRVKPSHVRYRPLEGDVVALTLSPLVDESYIEQYPNNHIVQLVWSDELYNFPWDKDWSHRDGVQSLLGTQNASYH